MRFLLDTHVFLWCVSDDRKLSKKSRLFISDADEVFISSASIWEISIKVKLGKLNVDMDEIVNAIAQSGFSELSVTTQHAQATFHLPVFHKDPFDRILLAQAITEPLKFLTADESLKEYSKLVEVI